MSSRRIHSEGGLVILAAILAAFAAVVPLHHHRCDGTHGRAHWGCVHRWHRRAALRLPRSSAVASWYEDGGTTACGFHAALGVAHLTLACGTRVELCAARCAIATVDDRGPYVAGRMWDLSGSTRAAIGASDLGAVRYSVLR